MKPLVSTLVVIMTVLTISSWSIQSARQYRVNKTTLSAHTIPSKSQSNSAFSIEYISPYVIGSSPMKISIRSIYPSTNVHVELLSPTNTRSDFFTFTQKLGKRKTISSTDVTLDKSILKENTQDIFSTNIPINTDPLGLTIKTNGVYPLKISTTNKENKTTTHYTFITYITNVSENNYAYSVKLDVVPLIEFSPVIDRSKIIDEKGQITQYGLDKNNQLLSAQSTIIGLNALGPHGVILSPEIFDAYTTLKKISNVQGMPYFLSTQPPDANTEYITDTYSPLNIAELEQGSFNNVFFDQFVYGRSIINNAGVFPSTPTLVTQTITKSALSQIANMGIKNVIVDDSTFSNEVQPNTQPSIFKSDDRSLKIGSAITSIEKYYPSRFSPSSQANYLIASSSVISLEKPSVKRSIIIPLDLSTVSTQTIQELFSAASTSPLFNFITPQTFFSQESNKLTSEKINRNKYGFTQPSLLSTEDISKIETASQGISSVFPDDSLYKEHSTWISNAVYSRADRNIGKVINQKTTSEFISIIGNKITLPDKRTLTITSRTSSIPVTIRNLTGSAAKVNIKIESDKLDLPNGNHYVATLNQENTTIRIPVKARTSGSFPVSISIVSPKNTILISNKTATVRSTVFSGIGITIALGSLLFLLIWWTLHARNSRKKPPAPIIVLSKPHQKGM